MRTVLMIFLVSLSMEAIAIDWMKPLPKGPPPPPSKATMDREISKLHKSCLNAIKKDQSLATSSPLRATPEKACACVGASYRRGNDLKAIAFVEAAYRGIDLKNVDEDIQNLYRDHAVDLEANCRRDPSYDPKKK